MEGQKPNPVTTPNTRNKLVLVTKADGSCQFVTAIIPGNPTLVTGSSASTVVGTSGPILTSSGTIATNPVISVGTSGTTLRQVHPTLISIPVVTSSTSGHTVLKPIQTATGLRGRTALVSASGTILTGVNIAQAVSGGTSTLAVHQVGSGGNITVSTAAPPPPPPLLTMATVSSGPTGVDVSTSLPSLKPVPVAIAIPSSSAAATIIPSSSGNNIGTVTAIKSDTQNKQQIILATKTGALPPTVVLPNQPKPGVNRIIEVKSDPGAEKVTQVPSDKSMPETIIPKAAVKKEEPATPAPDVSIVDPKVDEVKKSSVESMDGLKTPDVDFDPMSIMVWEEGVGTLPMSELKFKVVNGELEMIDDDEEEEKIRNEWRSKHHEGKKSESTKKSSQESSVSLSCNEVILDEDEENDPQHPMAICKNCGKKGPLGNFIRAGKFCSQKCALNSSSQIKSLIPKDHSSTKSSDTTKSGQQKGYSDIDLSEIKVMADDQKVKLEPEETDEGRGDLPMSHEMDDSSSPTGKKRKIIKRKQLLNGSTDSCKATKVSRPSSPASSSASSLLFGNQQQHHHRHQSSSSDSKKVMREMSKINGSSSGATSPNLPRHRNVSSESLTQNLIHNSNNSNNNNSSINNSEPLTVRSALHESIIGLRHATNSNHSDAPIAWNKHSKNLFSDITTLNPMEVLKWMPENVSSFVNSIPGCMGAGNIFSDELIDGEAFLLLTQMDIVKVLNIKLGPAIKIYNSILLIRDLIDV